MSSLLRGLQRLALGGAGTAARGRLPLPRPSCLAALRSRFSSAYTTAAARSRLPCHGFEGPYLICGDIADAPGREENPDAIDLARFAVAEHNSNTNAALVKVRHQLVAGDMYFFGGGVGANKLFEVKVWLRPREKFKGLHAFEPVANAD